MGRYLALAFDNISREPGAFLAASLYRIGRLFVLRGSDDTQTAHQFGGSRAIYGAGLVLSVGYLLLFLFGAAIAVRRHSQLRVLLVPVAYVPLTICFVLTNMRYTITVQPLMFAFVAMALVAAFRLEADGGGQPTAVNAAAGSRGRARRGRRHDRAGSGRRGRWDDRSGRLR